MVILPPNNLASLQRNHKPGLDTLQDFTISSLSLTIRLGVSHGRYIKPDVLSLTEVLHLTFRKVCAIIRNDVVWKAKPEYHLFDELNCRGCITLTDWLCFHPFGELVNCH